MPDITHISAASGRPSGRAPGLRSLAHHMRAELAARIVLDENGNRIDGNELIAKMFVDIAFYAEATLLDGSRMIVGAHDWLDAVKFLVNHIDGPAKQQVDVTSNGETIGTFLALVQASQESDIDAEFAG